jgi:predicted PolB exonuclease-like 3'-5' exonuclease
VRPTRLFVFDIETVVDDTLAAPLTGCDGGASLIEKRQAMTDYHLDVTEGKNPFPRQPFHRVVAISFLEAQITYNGNHESYTLTALRSGGKEDTGEADLVRGFFSHLSKPLARLVTFNGRTFDVPVLKYRAMKHGITAPWLYNAENKWENYQSRYASGWHADVLDMVSDFGASARVRLNEVCTALGFPGKFGLDGSMVEPYYDEGRLPEIRAYCETDVLNTYLVYLRVMQHRGVLKTDDYNHAIAEILSLIESSDKEHLKDFYQAWREASGDVFYLGG